MNLDEIKKINGSNRITGRIKDRQPRLNIRKIRMKINLVYPIVKFFFFFVALPACTQVLAQGEPAKSKRSSNRNPQYTAVVEYISFMPGEKMPMVQQYPLMQPDSQLNSEVVIEVDKHKLGQVMDGIGGSFNEQGWDALSAFPEQKRREVLDGLFHTKKGAGLCFNRIPIGASDFALSAYSLDDTKDDWELKDFSIKRDEFCLIPYIKAAQAVNSAMKFHASPWSPPGWMKTNGSQTMGGELLSDDRTLKSHAAYLVKFLQAYERNDITIDRLCPQNEPLVAGSYPGCKIPAPLYAKSVKNWILPAVKKSGLKTEVWAGTFNYWRQDTREHFDGILNDRELAEQVGGVSFQYSNINWMKEYLSKYPDVKIQHSESECYNGANAIEEAYRDFQDFVAYTKVGSRLFTFWNMVLPEPHASTWGWSQNSLVVIDKQKQRVTYQPSFSLAMLLGRHVVPASRYVPAVISKGENLIGELHFEPKDCVKFMQTGLDKGEQVAAFVKPDGGTVVFVLNQGNEVQSEIRMKGQKVVVKLPAKTLAAIVIK